MKTIELLCWNVNGIRPVKARGNMDWIQQRQPDIISFQETKIQAENLTEDMLHPAGYHSFWCHPTFRKGYSGVALYSKEEPHRVSYGFGSEEFDIEGRIIIAEYPDFTLFTIYFPNGKMNEVRLKYKMDFYEAFLKFLEPMLKRGEQIIVCGDVNTAHKEIDLARPKENSKYSGFLPEERAWLDKFISYGFVDTFRVFHPEPDQYSYWDIKTGARARNVGWRIDYFFITKNLLPNLKDAFILKDIQGSDHCPVGIRLEI